ncbi:MAG: glycosyltransferase family 4 protein [Solirubrobacterales bacterium]
MSSDRPRALMISENEGLPGDRRIWAEARTLTEAGYEVTAICAMAQGEDQPRRETLEGIAIRRFPLRAASGPAGYVREYAQALVRIRRLAAEAEREAGPFDVVHLSNPPDFLGLAAAAQRRHGARIVFDHHDLVPELYRERFGRQGPLYRLLLAIERRTLRGADVVISTNESFRRIAIERGGADPDAVFVVRNGPDLDRFTPVAADPALRRGKAHLLAYLGVMGPQDGIDRAIDALGELARLRGDDWHAVFIGDGEVVPAMQARAEELGIGDVVEFAGWRGDDDIRAWLDRRRLHRAGPPGPLNDASTMVKIPEYMAMGRPIVSFDLAETRVSAGDAALYAASAEPEALAHRIDELLEDPERARRMGEEGRRRVAGLSWEQSAAVLLEAYGSLTAARRAEPAAVQAV